jgi:orotate phosphoribosyltransferase
MAVHGHLTGVGACQPQQAAKQCRLAGAVRSEKAVDAADVDVEVEAVQCGLGWLASLPVRLANTDRIYDVSDWHGPCLHETTAAICASKHGSGTNPGRLRGIPDQRHESTRLVAVNDRDELLEQIKSKAVVHGRVVLSSGKEADYYVDLRRVTLDAVAAPLVGSVLLELTASLDYDAVGGLTLGADPVATAMLHAAAREGRHLDAFVVRKSEKQHGLQRRIEGPDVSGRRVLAVEDTSTTGGSVMTAVEALREAGAHVVAVAVIVDRGARAAIEAEGIQYLAAFERSDLGLD